MNQTITNNIDQIINKISPPLRKYEFTFSHLDGSRQVASCKGEDMKDAQKGLSYYYPGELTIYNCKDITNE